MGSGGKGSGGKAPKGWQGGGVGGDGARRSLKHTGARPVDGAGQGKGGTLRSASAATEQPNSHTDGHGQTRTVRKRAESRGQGRHRGGARGRVFPRYGKFIFDFCRCARKASLARPASPAAIDLAFALRLRLELGTRLFHGVEKWGGASYSAAVVWGGLVSPVRRSAIFRLRGRQRGSSKVPVRRNSSRRVTGMVARRTSLAIMLSHRSWTSTR